MLVIILLFTYVMVLPKPFFLITSNARIKSTLPQNYQNEAFAKLFLLGELYSVRYEILRVSIIIKI